MNKKRIIAFKNKIFKNIIIFFLFFLSYYLYYLSLEKCTIGFDICCRKRKWIKKKLIQIILSSIIASILYVFIFFGLISTKHLIHFITVFKIFYKLSNGKDFDDHGFYNFIGYFSVSLTLTIILVFIIKIKSLIKKKNSFSVLIIIIIIIFLYTFFSNSLVNCNDWTLGLNMTNIENNINRYGCQIIFPKICAYKIGKYFLDITKLKKKNCTKKKQNARIVLLKYSKSKNIRPTTKKFGFPITTNHPICCYDSHKGFKDYEIFYEYIRHNMIDMDNMSQIEKLNEYEKPEVVVDFSSDPFGEMIINLNYHKNLSETRKKLENNTTPYSENIIILYFDSVSRANSIRELKKTLKFFEKFMKYKKSDLNKGFHSFQFLKYHAFDMYTGYNYPILFYGDNSGSHIIRITKFLKENGYITCLANDFCYRDNCRSFHKMKKEEVYDHQMTICDPNQEHWNNMEKRCLYGKINSEHLFEYGNQFWRKDNKNRKFLTMISNDGHEGTLQEIKYTDEIIFNFLFTLFNESLIDKTSILLISDHGESLPSFYYIP